MVLREEKRREKKRKGEEGWILSVRVGVTVHLRVDCKYFGLLTLLFHLSYQVNPYTTKLRDSVLDRHDYDHSRPF